MGSSIYYVITEGGGGDPVMTRGKGVRSLDDVIMKKIIY